MVTHARIHLGVAFFPVISGGYAIANPLCEGLFRLLTEITPGTHILVLIKTVLFISFLEEGEIAGVDL